MCFVFVLFFWFFFVFVSNASEGGLSLYSDILSIRILLAKISLLSCCSSSLARSTTQRFFFVLSKDVFVNRRCVEKRQSHTCERSGIVRRFRCAVGDDGSATVRVEYCCCIGFCCRHGILCGRVASIGPVARSQAQSRCASNVFLLSLAIADFVEFQLLVYLLPQHMDRVHCARALLRLSPSRSWALVSRQYTRSSGDDSITCVSTLLALTLMIKLARFAPRNELFCAGVDCAAVLCWRRLWIAERPHF